VADTEGNDLKEADPSKKTGSKKPQGNKVKSILNLFLSKSGNQFHLNGDFCSKEADTERGLTFDRTNGGKSNTVSR